MLEHVLVSTEKHEINIRIKLYVSRERLHNYALWRQFYCEITGLQ
jgi:hypothetical protein